MAWQFLYFFAFSFCFSIKLWDHLFFFCRIKSIVSSLWFEEFILLIHTDWFSLFLDSEKKIRKRNSSEWPPSMTKPYKMRSGLIFSLKIRKSCIHVLFCFFFFFSNTVIIWLTMSFWKTIYLHGSVCCLSWNGLNETAWDIQSFFSLHNKLSFLYYYYCYYWTSRFHLHKFRSDRFE